MKLLAAAPVGLLLALMVVPTTILATASEPSTGAPGGTTMDSDSTLHLITGFHVACDQDVIGAIVRRNAERRLPHGRRL